jgi:hypothetical protein
MDEVDWSKLAPWLFTGGAGMIGRLMYHAKQVQLGKKKPLSWALVWDIPIALGTGWIALGLCKWWGLGWEATVSVAIVSGYLGPYGIDTIFDKWSERKFNGNKKEE